MITVNRFKSRKQKIVGALAPVVAFGLSIYADEKLLSAEAGARRSAIEAIETAAVNSMALPTWAKMAMEEPHPISQV